MPGPWIGSLGESTESIHQVLSTPFTVAADGKDRECGEWVWSIKQPQIEKREQARGLAAWRSSTQQCWGCKLSGGCGV